MAAEKPNLGAYLGFVPNRLKLTGWAVLLAAAQGAVIVALGLAVRRIFDQAVPDGNLREAALLCGGLLLVYGVEILLESTATMRISDIVRRALLNLRTHLAAHALRLPRAFYSRSDIGSLHVDWVQETGRVEAATRGAMTVMAPHLASALAVACFMLALNVWLSLLVWLVLVLGLVAILRIRPRVRSAVHEMHTAQRHFSRHVLFLLEMMDLVRLKNAEAEALRRISRFLAVADRQPYQGHESCSRLMPIHLEGVTFSYDDSPPLIRDLNLVLSPGEILVLTGPSGEDFDLWLRMQSEGQAVYKTTGAAAEVVPRTTFTAFYRQRKWYREGEAHLRAKHGDACIDAATLPLRIPFTTEMRILAWGTRLYEQLETWWQPKRNRKA